MPAKPIQFGDESIRAAFQITNLASEFLARGIQQHKGGKTVHAEPLFKLLIGLFQRGVLLFVAGKIQLSPARACFWRSRLNLSVDNTSWSNLMHQPHQSEPVKSSSTILFSDRAWFKAADKSVFRDNSETCPADDGCAGLSSSRRSRRRLVDGLKVVLGVGRGLLLFHLACLRRIVTEMLLQRGIELAQFHIAHPLA